MCMAVYIAADQPLTLVIWDDAHAAFYLADVDQADLPVLSQFTKAHVAYAGSHEGCGCGSQYGEYPEFREPEEAVARRASLDQFAAYLAGELTRVGPIELYACWDGDQTAAVEHRRALTPLDLQSEEVFFLQKELSLVAAAP
jgi:hypothetical protein